MVIKGKARGGPGKLAKHFESEENERVTVIGIHGLAARDIEGALVEMDARGHGKIERTLYSASINVGYRDAMPEKNWEVSRQTLMAAFGAQDQPYIEIEHEKKGRIHRHIVFPMWDAESERGISDSHNYRKHEEVARGLERQFGHERVQGAHVERDGVERPGRTPTQDEMQQAKRSGITAEEAKELGAQLWRTTDSGKAFAAGLEDHGWMLARGDRRGFVLIDPTGEIHSIRTRVNATAAEIRNRMADLDPASLPGVDQAKAMQHERQLAAERTAAPGAPIQPPDVAAEIDQAAERAMQEARAAAKGRYDRLDETHRQVARDQCPGRYDELRAAEPPPEVVREFDASANRTAEPAAPVYDRDADNAAWEAKLADAAIAAAQKARQQPGDSAGRDTRSGGPEPSGGPAARPEPEDMRPLGKTAGEIRAAWTLSRSAGELEEALAAKGITLAVVSAEEARQSERTAAFAKVVGNFDRVLKENEIVAVNQYGDVFRLDQRTTGAAHPDIAARFPQLDRAALLNVTAATEVLRDAATAVARDEARQWREMNTPLTGIETTIADALANTMTGAEFAEALDKAGITLTRATPADEKALGVLRDQADLAAAVAFSENTNIDRDARHFDRLINGDYAAVTRSGDVFRLNPTALNFEEAEQRLADVQPRMAPVIEARALNEQTREQSAEFWAELRAWNAEARAERDAAYEGDRALHATVNAGERGVENTLHAADDAVNAGLDAASGAFAGFAKAVEKVLGGILGFLGGGEVKLTPQQARDQVRADGNEETLHARAAAADERARMTDQDWRIFEQDRQQQQEELERNMGYRERPGDRERERERDWP